ncbi:B- and T-lymphocyte attenuator isoform X2 [Phascolarctos cinereus]|uniref:B- and T-lymphocyte attenuator isoform X2 n=1 Tax=Phascolarctos cinereus TaxID=38626 RepID=A0A6P5LZR2_PHACI|nr:B- and T-lymphocyte attenuator isoform X2 [Phascolarctos cinereus]
MKTSPVMYKNEVFLHVIFMASALGISFVQGNSLCFRPLVHRGTSFTTSPGKLLVLKCPVKQCGENLNVSWIKENGTQSSQIRDGLWESRPWDKEKNLTMFSLHFDPVLDGDGGSYQCIVNFSKKSLFSSHHINVYITNSTEAPLEQRPENETRPWLLYMLLSMGLLSIFILTCLGLFFWQRKKRAKQKKHPDTLGRGTNQVTPHQPFDFNQAEEGTIYNSTLPRPLPLSSETIIYNNDAWPKIQLGTKVIYSNQGSEENQPGIVYASLNHSANGVNFLRRAERVTEQPTEYASICMRN